MKIIGINAYHADSSACLVINGKLINAVEEERFTRIKHWAGFPIQSIKFCLKNSNLKISDIDKISLNFDPNANLLKKIFFIIKKRPSVGLIVNRLKRKKKYQSIKTILDKEFTDDKFKGDIENIEHHYVRLSSAYHVSPFDKACVLSVDGFGDFASTAWGFGENNQIIINKKVYFPHSLGIFYQAITQFLGFKNYGDEYKIMGLAPYGKPTFVKKLKEILQLNSDGTFKLNLDYFNFYKQNFSYKWDAGEIKVEDLYSEKLINLLGEEKTKKNKIDDFHKDLAHSTQKVYEEAFLNILNNLFKKYKNENLCISGGCGMNSVANGKILNNTNFKNIYVQPAAGDAGGSIGAADASYFKNKKNKKNFQMTNSYWGTSFDDKQILKTINENEIKIRNQNCKHEKILDDESLCKIVSKSIAEGKVVGWFQDKMEWGPRALGNRSILGDPRRADMKDILNIKIKRRESFRPFAPSILREYVKDWFEQEDDVPFMMKVYQVKKNKRQEIPAVTHVDGSGRLQTVKHETNSKYYNLIKQFYKLTNVPILLNTSFNENELIVNNPKEAFDCFLIYIMNYLVM